MRALQAAGAPVCGTSTRLCSGVSHLGTADIWGWVFAVQAGPALQGLSSTPGQQYCPLLVMIESVFRHFQKSLGVQKSPLVKNPCFGGFHVSFVNILNLLKI